VLSDAHADIGLTVAWKMEFNLSAGSTSNQ